MVRIRRVDLEAVDLCQVVKPVIDREGGVLVGWDIPGAQAGTKQDPSSVLGNCAEDLKFGGCLLLVCNIKL